MDKELFKETENKLRRYFTKTELINSLKTQVKRLESQIEGIQKEIDRCDVTLEPTIPPISYGERIQTSSDGTSYAERETMRITECKISRIVENELKRQRFLQQIDDIENEYIYIQDAFDQQLSDELKEILELKYKKKYGERKIAQMMHMDQSSVNRKKKTALELIADWGRWNNAC